MDTKLIAHVSGELIILAGISFYFHRRISAQDSRITQLEKDNEELVKAVDYLNAQFSQLVRLMQGNKIHHKPKVAPPVSEVRESPPKKPVQIGEKPKIIELPKNELDSELEQELKELEHERLANGRIASEKQKFVAVEDSEPREETSKECEGGVCKLD